MSASPRLSLPFLSVGQAQKEFTHNESIAILDLMVAAAVAGPPQTSVPASPVPGDAFLVAAGATGAWAGKDGCIAGWTSGGWRFVAPLEGMAVHDRSSGVTIRYRSGAWESGKLRAAAVLIGGQQVVGPQSTAIAGPSGGSTVDSEARSAIAAILVALRQHGMVAT